MSDPVQHPDFTRALDLIDKGDPSLMLTLTLRARRRAEHGSYCECSTPLVDGDGLMCRVCLHNNRDQEIRKLLASTEREDRTMSDTPPPELVDRLARVGIPASERRPDALDRQRAWNMLQALAEWADGGLIDPSTWTVVDATVGMNASPDHCYDCDGDGCSMCLPMFILTPREGER